MSCRFSPEHPLARLALGVGAFAIAFVLPLASASAAPKQVLPFSVQSWRTLTAAPTTPKIVVFSTTDCAHCPAVIAALAQAARSAARPVPLSVVVMDGAGHNAALLKDAHLRPADVLYAFDGDDAALRYSVNPGWRGLTPYVAFVHGDGNVDFHTGAPPAAATARFVGR